MMMCVGFFYLKFAQMKTPTQSLISIHYNQAIVSQRG